MTKKEKLERLTEGEKKLYKFLKENSRNGLVQISQKEIGAHLGVDQPTVCKRMRTLKMLKLVAVEILMERGRPNLMFVN